MRRAEGGGARRRSVVFFSPTLGEGHLRRVLPLVSALARRGLPVHVYTHRTFRDLVERSGGGFVDLFARHTLEDADAESTLMGCKQVSFAGHFAHEVVEEILELEPGLLVCDTFAVVGRAVGSVLDLPFVNVCNGHDFDPDRYVAEMRAALSIVVSERCERAVELLRVRYGLADATPFSYLHGHSPHLNLYSEPAEWLPESRRQAFEPVAFYGSLPSDDPLRSEQAQGIAFPRNGERLKVYVSFGTVPWWWWPDHILETLERLTAYLGRRDDVSAVVGLGRSTVEGAVEQLARQNVAVARYVDQWRVLQDADVFVTHNGLSSTHEAIYHLVPMLSYPIFADQPALAQLCRSFGLALPLVETPRAGLSEERLETALAEVGARRDAFRVALECAREWELAALADREEVHERIVGLLAQR